LKYDIIAYSDAFVREGRTPRVGFTLDVRSGPGNRVVRREGTALADLAYPLSIDSTAAEYWALGHAARQAALAWRELTTAESPSCLFKVDNQSMVKVLTEGHRTRTKYADLAAWVRAGFEPFSAWNIEWVKRSANSRADALSRAGETQRRGPRTPRSLHAFPSRGSFAFGDIVKGWREYVLPEVISPEE